MEQTGSPAKVASTAGLGPLPEVGYLGDDASYGYDALDMREYAAAEVARAVAAERERCAAIARRWGETHADGVTVNARNAASKIARGIEGPNVRGNLAGTAAQE